MGRKHAKHIGNTAFTFEISPRKVNATSRQKRRHPEQYGILVKRSVKDAQREMQESNVEEEKSHEE